MRLAREFLARSGGHEVVDRLGEVLRFLDVEGVDLPEHILVTLLAPTLHEVHPRRSAPIEEPGGLLQKFALGR